MKTTAFAIAFAAALGTSAAAAQEKIRVGLMLTLSGPTAVLGQQARDGFNLGVKTLGGKMGGRDVEVIVADDELRPDVAVLKVRGLLERDKVDFIVGPIFSNVAAAIHKPIVDANAFFISPNAGPSIFAGKGCHPNVFVTSYQNDTIHEILGKVAQDRGYKRIYLLAPNYQAGKDSIAGFKRHFKGEVVEESYVPLNTLDFQSELAKIASMKPDAVLTFMPGGMGVNLVRQYSQAGLKDRVAFLSTFTVDESTLPAQQDAAVGLFGGMNWAPTLDNPTNKAFVNAFEKEYNYPPSVYAAFAYDTAMLLESSLKATSGSTTDKNALREAIRKADFSSVRGKFQFNVNGFPIQDHYLVKAVKRPDGKFQTEIVEKVFSDYSDVHAKDCKPAS